MDQTPSANITDMSTTPTCMDIVQLATCTYLPLNKLVISVLLLDTMVLYSGIHTREKAFVDQ